MKYVLSLPHCDNIDFKMFTMPSWRLRICFILKFIRKNSDSKPLSFT